MHTWLDVALLQLVGPFCCLVKSLQDHLPSEGMMSVVTVVHLRWVTEVLPKPNLYVGITKNFSSVISAFFSRFEMLLPKHQHGEGNVVIHHVSGVCMSPPPHGQKAPKQHCMAFHSLQPGMLPCSMQIYQGHRSTKYIKIILYS